MLIYMYPVGATPRRFYFTHVLSDLFHRVQWQPSSETRIPFGPCDQQQHESSRVERGLFHHTTTTQRLIFQIGAEAIAYVFDELIRVSVVVFVYSPQICHGISLKRLLWPPSCHVMGKSSFLLMQPYTHYYYLLLRLLIKG